MLNFREVRKQMLRQPETKHYLSAAVALRLSEALRCRLRFGFLVRSSLKNITLPRYAPHQKGVCWSTNAFYGTLMSISFFKGDESGSASKDSRELQSSSSKTSKTDFDWKWTKILLSVNVLVYAEQYVSGPKLLQWGGRINSLISKGQWWRLATSSFLHVNLAHLLMNCYSLYAVGPAVEKLCGPERFLTVYVTSALASSAMGYKFSKASSVGASGAIFGLVGSYVVYLLRHRDMLQGSDDALKHIALVILLNTMFGLGIGGIDHWGHLGGFIGGAAVSWFVGPAWELKSVSILGRKTYEDKAPIFSLIGLKRPTIDKIV